MKIISYEKEGRWASGFLCSETVVDAVETATAAGWSAEDVRQAATGRGLLELGPSRVRELHECAAGHRTGLGSADTGLPLEQVRLGPPVANPRKIVCTGLNYVDHAKEVGAPIPETPVFFPKYDNSLAGPVDPIVPPRDTNEVDYEGELAVVIGERGRYIEEADALSHLAGAMVFNDVSARDLQLATPTWTGGKAVDTFGPCGPCLVTLDEIDDIQSLYVRTWVDGRLVQDGHTSQMIFSVAYLVSFLSRIMTLEPGDIIITGTPAGVGKSFSPPLYLQEGNVVEVEIEGLGRLKNPVAPAV